MKTVIGPGECGFLVKNGVFVRMLGPGKHSYHAAFGYAVHVVQMDGEVDAKGIPFTVLLCDKAFAASVARATAPDDGIVLHYIDGLFCGVIESGDRYFWNVHHKNTFVPVPLATPEVQADFPRYAFLQINASLYRRIEVGEGQVALLYYDNQYQRTLSPGLYHFWNYKTAVSSRVVDLREQQLEIGGQEILTADKVGVRLNLTCSYHVADPVSLCAKLTSPSSQLYTLVQLAVRELIGTLRIDELLDQKGETAGRIMEYLRARQADYFVEFTFAGIKDIILPGEIRDIMNTVLVAEKTAQASVITRREEVASTRSLLNTAKLMEENQTLYKLKELEYLERICDRVGGITLSGAGNVLEQLGAIAGVGKS